MPTPPDVSYKKAQAERRRVLRTGTVYLPKAGRRYQDRRGVVYLCDAKTRAHRRVKAVDPSALLSRLRRQAQFFRDITRTK